MLYICAFGGDLDTAAKDHSIRCVKLWPIWPFCFHFWEFCAYVFVRSETTWTQQQKLLASNAWVIDKFGYSVSISGDYAVVATYRNDDGVSNSGGTYMLKRFGTTRTEQQKLKGFWLLSICGGYAVTGAENEYNSETAYVGASSCTSSSASCVNRAAEYPKTATERDYSQSPLSYLVLLR